MEQNSNNGDTPARQLSADGRPGPQEDGRPVDGAGREKSDKGISRYFELCDEASQGKIESEEA